MTKKNRKYIKKTKCTASELKEDQKKYINIALVEKTFGHCNFGVKLLDGTTRLAHVQNGPKKTRIKIGGYVLVQPESENVFAKQEIVRIYSSNEATALKKEGRLRVIEEKELKEKEQLLVDFERDEEVTNTGFSDNEIDVDNI